MHRVGARRCQAEGGHPALLRRSELQRHAAPRLAVLARVRARVPQRRAQLERLECGDAPCGVAQLDAEAAELSRHESHAAGRDQAGRGRRRAVLDHAHGEWAAPDGYGPKRHADEIVA